MYKQSKPVQLLLLSLFTLIMLNSCSAQSNQMDTYFVPASQNLLQLIKQRDTSAIYKLMWSESAVENKRGDVLKNDLKVINQYLDTIANIKQLPYQVSIDNRDPLNYAVVTIPLRTGEAAFKVLVYFSHPELGHKGQVRTYDFKLEPSSYKLNKHIKVGGTGS